MQRLIRPLRFLYLGALYEVLGRALPGVLARQMRARLFGIWSHLEGAVPSGGAVLIANHHSWWDVHLGIAIAGHHQRPSAGVMDEGQLAAFPFFRKLGIVGRHEVRQAVRLAKAGHFLVVYVEGELRAPGALGPAQPGAAAIAKWAEVPLFPCAVRVVMRGADRPEVYLRVAEPLPPGTTTDELSNALSALLARLDSDLLAAPDPEAPLPGYQPWWPPRPRDHERIARWKRFWGAR